MKALSLVLAVCAGLCFALSFDVGGAEIKKQIVLQKPQMHGGMPLMQALRDRRSGRSFSSKRLPDRVLSNLLWAAFGVNRPSTGKRTAPSTMNWQEIDVYLATPEGLYLYDAKRHALDLVLAGDIRALTGKQDFVKDAPLNLIYVADLTKMAGVPAAEQVMYSGVDTGLISQNVYLYCASEGLSTVVRAHIDYDALAEAMNLKSSQRIIASQTVGYPK